MQQCPCFSGKKYNECCQKFHSGTQPNSALELMRSRYAAYAMQNSDYIMETTDPDGPQFLANSELWKAQIEEFAKMTTFKGLEIVDAEETVVHFRAILERENHDMSFEERSLFKKRNGKWLYSECLELEFNKE